MNDEVGSVMNFFYDLFPCKVYTLEVPEKFVVPSMYYPPPLVFDSNDTNMTYMKTYSLPVKLFHRDSQKAIDKADMLADALRRKKGVIPLVDVEGKHTGHYIRMTRIETRLSESGVAIITLNWDSRYFYEREEYAPLENIDIDSGVKE